MQRVAGCSRFAATVVAAVLVAAAATADSRRGPVTSPTPTTVLPPSVADGFDWPLAIVASQASQLPAGSQFEAKSRRFTYERGTGARTSAIEIAVEQRWDEIGLGCVVWEAAEILSQHLIGMDLDWREVRSLELGAGVGLASLVAWHLGAARSVATDRGKVLQCTRQNMLLNMRLNNATPGDRYRVAQLDWGSDDAAALQRAHGGEGGFDLIMGSDLVYDESVFAPLVATLDALTAPTARNATVTTTVTVLLAGKKRYEQRFKQFRRLLKSRFTSRRLRLPAGRSGYASSHYLYALERIPVPTEG